MKVKDLLEEIDRCRREYPDFLDWDVYTEQCSEGDKEIKRAESGFGSGWKIVKEDDFGDIWEHFYCAGYWTKMPKERIFTINVNY